MGDCRVLLNQIGYTFNKPGSAFNIISLKSWTILLVLLSSAPLNAGPLVGFVLMQQKNPHHGALTLRATPMGGSIHLCRKYTTRSVKFSFCNNPKPMGEANGR